MIYILSDPKTNVYDHKLTHYRSFVWCEKMSEAGEFEIVYTGQDDALDSIHLGDCVALDTKYSHAYGYIESVSGETDSDGVKTKKYVGRTAEVILEKCSAMTIRPTRYAWLRQVIGTTIGTDEGTGKLAGAAKYRLVNGEWQRYGRIAGCVNPNFEMGLTPYCGWDKKNVTAEWKIDSDGTSYVQCKWNGTTPGWGWFGTQKDYNNGIPTNTRRGAKFHFIFDINIPRERYGTYDTKKYPGLNRINIIETDQSGKETTLMLSAYPNTSGDLRVEGDVTLKPNMKSIRVGVGVAGIDKEADKDFTVNIKRMNWYLVDYGTGGPTNPPQLPDDDPVYYYDGNSKYFEIFPTRNISDAIKPVDLMVRLIDWTIFHRDDHDVASALGTDYKLLSSNQNGLTDNGTLELSNFSRREYRDNSYISYAVGPKSIYEYASQVAKDYNIMFCLIRLNGNLSFGISDGVSHTVDSPNPVVFSPQLKNFVQGSWVDTKKNYSTLAAVYGDGEFVLVDMYGADYEKISTVSNPVRDPLLIVDATSELNKEDFESAEDYRKALISLGAAKLRQESNDRWSTESEISEKNTIYKYEKDFYLGSIVTVVDDDNIRRDMQVTEYTFSMDENGLREWPTLTDYKEFAPNTWSTQGTTKWTGASGYWNTN